MLLTFCVGGVVCCAQRAKCLNLIIMRKRYQEVSMSAYIVVGRNDHRHEALKKGFNLRWPSNGQGADFIYVCKDRASVWAAANDALKKIIVLPFVAAGIAMKVLCRISWGGRRVRNWPLLI